MLLRGEHAGQVGSKKAHSEFTTRLESGCRGRVQGTGWQQGGNSPHAVGREEGGFLHWIALEVWRYGGMKVWRHGGMKVWRCGGMYAPYLDKGSQICNGHQGRNYVGDDFAKPLVLLLVAIMPACGGRREGRWLEGGGIAGLDCS